MVVYGISAVRCLIVDLRLVALMYTILFLNFEWTDKELLVELLNEDFV